MKDAATGWVPAIVLSALALLYYCVIEVWTHVKSIPEEAAVRTQPVPDAHDLRTLATGLACSALFPGIVEDRQQPFSRWREYNRTRLRAAETGALRAGVVQAVDAEKSRYASASPEERQQMEFRCRFSGAFDIPTAPVHRALEVLSNYQVCAEVVPWFSWSHALDLWNWKRRNEEGVDAITCCRQFGRDGTNGGKDYIRQLNTRRERELHRLREGGPEALEEQVAFCRSTVVRWIRSGT